MAATTANREKINRQTRTPFLLKLFYRTGAFHRSDEFIASPSSPLPPHLQIYTWFSCSLRELTHLLTSALPTLLPEPAIGTTLVFRLIFPDTRSQSPTPIFKTRDLGKVVIGAGGPGVPGAENGNAGAGGAGSSQTDDADMTLQDVLPQFIIGDYITCAIFPPLANGTVAAQPPSYGSARGGRGDYGGGGRGAGYGGPRENGFGVGGFRVRGSARGGPMGSFGGDRGVMPSGEWRRGERLPEGPGGYGRGRGRGRGY